MDGFDKFLKGRMTLGDARAAEWARQRDVENMEIMRHARSPEEARAMYLRAHPESAVPSGTQSRTVAEIHESYPQADLAENNLLWQDRVTQARPQPGFAEPTNPHNLGPAEARAIGRGMSTHEKLCHRANALGLHLLSGFKR